VSFNSVKKVNSESESDSFWSGIDIDISERQSPFSIQHKQLRYTVKQFIQSLKDEKIPGNKGNTLFAQPLILSQLLISTLVMSMLSAATNATFAPSTSSSDNAKSLNAKSQQPAQELSLMNAWQMKRNTKFLQSRPVSPSKPVELADILNQVDDNEDFTSPASIHVWSSKAPSADTPQSTIDLWDAYDSILQDETDEEEGKEMEEVKRAWM
jgi:hypothetical protein